MYTSSPVPQYGQEHEVGGEEKDTTTGFRRFGTGNSPEVPWSVMTQGHCLAHFPRRHTTTYTVAPIKDFDIFIHNMKMWTSVWFDGCLMGNVVALWWVASPRTLPTGRDRGVWDMLVIGMPWEIGPIKEYPASPRSMLSVPTGSPDPPGRTSGTETVSPETSIAGTTALRTGGEHISITGAKVRLDRGLGV